MSINYTLGEEVANSVSHGVGIIFGIVAGFVLMNVAIQSGNSWAIGSVPLYLFGTCAPTTHSPVLFLPG